MINILTILSLSIFLAFTAVAQPTVDETIAKARERVGGEANIGAIDTIYYKGTYQGVEDDNKGTVEIYLKEPCYQYIKTSLSKVIEITANNDFEGFRKRINPDATDEWAVNVLSFQELKSIKINSMENLGFFAKPTVPLSYVEDMGLSEVDGQPAHVIKYVYSKDLWYKRSFALSDGRLLATENASGLLVKEKGEIVANGVQFPKEIHTFLNGEKTSTVTFEEVKVNLDIDNTMFDLPSLTE